MQITWKASRSEGFSRTGYLLPARGTPGVSPDGESCWDAAVVAAAAVTWKFRSTFWLGNYIWSLSLWKRTQMGHLGTSVPGFCTEFRYLSYGHSGLAWGAIFEASPNIRKMWFLTKWTCLKIQKNANFQKKNAGGQRPLGSQKLLRILAPYEIFLFYRKLKKWRFPKKVRFGWKKSGQSQKTMKPKMVRMVRRNILYDGDLEICDSKSWFWRKSKKWHFLNWSLRKWKWRFGTQHGVFWVVVQPKML